MTKRLPHTYTWLPFLALVAIVLASAVLGRGLVPQATGATVVEVTGSIPADIFIDPSNCSASAVAIGDLVPGTDPWKTAQDQGGQTCSVDFGTTNHTPGTTLSMLEDPAAPASPADAMKCVAGGCGGNSIADYSGGAEPAAGTSAFGAQLLSSSGVAAPIWTAAPAVHAVTDAASPACDTPSIGTGTCAFTWGATASATQPSGNYQAQARLVVLGN